MKRARIHSNRLTQPCIRPYENVCIKSCWLRKCQGAASWFVRFIIAAKKKIWSENGVYRSSRSRSSSLRHFWVSGPDPLFVASLDRRFSKQCRSASAQASLFFLMTLHVWFFHFHHGSRTQLVVSRGSSERRMSWSSGQRNDM